MEHIAERIKEHTIKRIKALTEKDTVMINPSYGYVSDEWGMNRGLSMSGELISVPDLKAIVKELEELRQSI